MILQLKLNRKIMLNKRKNKVRIIILILLLINTVNIKSQDINFQFISKMKVNEILKKRIHGKQETIKFWGTIVDINGKSLFKVVSVISKIQASKVIHGQTQVIFLEPKSYTIAKIYNLSIPEELPFKLEKNKLFFYYKDKNGKRLVYTNEIEANLPKLLCVAPDDCY